MDLRHQARQAGALNGEAFVGAKIALICGLKRERHRGRPIVAHACYPYSNSDSTEVLPMTLSTEG